MRSRFGTTPTFDRQAVGWIQGRSTYHANIASHGKKTRWRSLWWAVFLMYVNS